MAHIRQARPDAGRRSQVKVLEVSRGEKMTPRKNNPESYITEYTSVYEDEPIEVVPSTLGRGPGP